MGAATVLGCSGSVDVPGAGGSGSTSSGQGTTSVSTGAGAGAGVAIAITKLRLGAESPTAWESYGSDIDGVNTSAENVLTQCKPNSSGSAKATFIDGAGGVDNSWGRNLVPIFKSLAGSGSLEDIGNEPISKGRSTLILDFANLGTGDTQSPLAFFGLTGTNKSGSSWPIAPEPLAGSTPETSVMTFQSASLTGNALLAKGGVLLVSLGILPDSMANGAMLHLKLHAASVRATLSQDHTTIQQGILSGVLDTEEFAAEANRVMGAWSKDLCGTMVTQSVLTQIRQASDIMTDGTQNPSVTCDGISIGLGFDGAVTTLGAVAPPTPSEIDPCL
ncbi:MAG: hypothetical protein U0414_14225 [Polyangiaceae bacterium]